MSTAPTYNTLRAWLDRLAATDRVAVCRDGVDLKFDIAAISKRLDGERATVFPKAGGHHGSVVSGIVSSRAWMAEILGVEEDQLLAHFQQAADNPTPWQETDNAPVQEVVHRDVDIAKILPVPIHNEHDGGQYISAGLLISRDPDSGVQNVSINRLQLQGGNRLGVLILPRHTWTFYDRAESKGEPLQIAIVVGADPISLLASQAIVPLGNDELEIAGSLQGRALPVAKCLTNDVRVPAEAEIVLEGRVLPHVREEEGPFGEFPQYYGQPAKRHVIEIDAITHRPNPLFHTIVGGALEHLILGQIPRESTLLAHLKRSFPNVVDVHLPRGGTCRYSMVVKLDQKQEGEAKNVILGSFAGHNDIKHVVIVDTDVNIYDPVEVEWAVVTRTQADRDYVVISGALGSKLDPSTEDGVTAKIGIDATKPLTASGLDFKRIHVPGEDTIDPEDYIDNSAIADFRQSLKV